MNQNLVPIACGTALALMAGAVTAHWSSVRDMTRLASAVPHLTAPVSPRVAATMPEDGVTREAKEFLAEARGSRTKAGTVPTGATAMAAPSKASATDDRIERLLQLLEGTVQQNQELRDRIAETNRDLMELRFQVDSYDGQFRPLNVNDEPSPLDDTDTGLLPPYDGPLYDDSPYDASIDPP